MAYSKEQRLADLAKTPLMDASDYCSKCTELQELVNKYIANPNSLTQDELAVARYKCVYCRNKYADTYGILKLDAILTLTALVKKHKTNTKGKQSKAEKRYGTAVRNLHKEKRSIRDIAATLGISPNTVWKILNNKL